MKIAVIPARGGSKRIPRKNIMPFNGRPMIAWSIEAAKSSGLFDRVIVSTDDSEIAEVSRYLGAEVPFTRPEELSTDFAGTIEVIAHAAQWAADQGMNLKSLCCIYATAPFISGILSAGEEFIFRVKQGDHKKLYNHIETAPYESLKKTADGSKTTIAHRWYKDVPLNGSTDITVTVIQAFGITTDKKGNKKSTTLGVWATNLDVNDVTVAEVTRAGRSRWKIENECFNALKNQGYDLTHNWGHVNGESFNFYLLTMLAFYIHQILDMTDPLFQWCRRLGRTFKQFWNDMEFLFRMFLFDSWESMLCFYIERNEETPPLLI